MRVFISIIIIAFFLLVPDLYAESKNRVVAFVNDDVITLYELNNTIEEKTGKTSEELHAANEQEFFNIRKTVLDGLIMEKLANEKIKELELVPTKEQIDQYVENIKQNYKITQEELVAELKKEGRTYEKFRKVLKDELGRRTLIDVEIREKLIISDDQIADYYESHKKEFEKPGRAHIASIYLIPEPSGMDIDADKLRTKGEKILARLKKGESFSDLAREFSNGPGAEEGGDLGNITLTDVDPKILEVINSLKDGEVSSLIDMGNRFQIIKLINKTETEWDSLESVKAKIAESLYQNEWEKRYKEYMEELKANSYIKIIL